MKYMDNWIYLLLFAIDICTIAELSKNEVCFANIAAKRRTLLTSWPRRHEASSEEEVVPIVEEYWRRIIWKEEEDGLVIRSRVDSGRAEVA